MHLKFFRIISLFLLSCLCLSLFFGCGSGAGEKPSGSFPAETRAAETETFEPQDYASQVTLNMASETAKQEVTVKTYVDGDTVHFNVPSSIDPSQVLKARFLAINTPESTGKIEEFGKAASRFTRERLSEAESIIIESETDQWNPDSTGTRYLCWIWYKTPEDSDYRNLNIEILQNGLAKANSTANNRYGSAASAALEQAKAQKLNLYSGEKDPDFFYGEAVELTLKELRLHVKDYEGMKVAFTGTVMMSGDNSVYVESYDPELDLSYGMYIYYGFNLPGEGMEILSLGNEVRIVGTVQYYEAGDSWQVSGLKYRAMKPEDPNNLKLVSSGHEGRFPVTDPHIFVNGTVTLETEEGSLQKPYWELALNSSVSMENLQVLSAETTNDVRSAAKGAMTLTCQADGETIQVRTAVLRDENGEVITDKAYLGKTIDVRGVITSFHGVPQIKVYSPKGIKVQ